MQHTFQSFWWGDALSPYESVCLKSFVDRGHAFDLYTFDPETTVPNGVRVRDASELVERSAFFVYPDGPGKGSPSAFANLFRYKLLRDRGGWWVDTDVLCLSDEYPCFEEFFARQDASYVNCAVLFFKPGDPVMARCFARAHAMGPPERWGATGPHLLTEVLAQTDGLGRAFPASVCYPVHFPDAVDLVRPSRREALAPSLESSLFLHLWNAMLVRSGIRKHCLPPRGSLLREVVDRHPVDGWTGEYDEQLLEQTLSSSAALARLDEQCRLLDAELARTRTELGGTHAALADTQAVLAGTQATLAATQAELTGRQAALAERDAELDRAHAALAACAADAERQALELRRHREDAAAAHAGLAEIIDSTSWRVTAPLRAVGLRYPRLRGLVKAARAAAGSRTRRPADA